ncbi:MAG: GNAT family N-acetyltransferase [Inquilinaceae bacterium]
MTPGKLRVTITELEMTAPPRRPPPPPPLAKLAFLRAEQPTVSFYRYLYDTVGTPWLWSDRRALDDDALTDILEDRRTTVYVLYYGGVPAGFAELFLEGARTHLVYFGLVPDFIGRGIGPFLLDCVIRTAWDGGKIKRLTVKTCDLDHPRALATYQAAGFTLVGRDVEVRDDPRVTGVIPRDAAPHRPIAAD